MVKNLPANAGDVRDTGLIPGSGRPLKKDTAPHSSILAWRIPRTEEPGRLQSMGLHRVGHDRNDLARIPNLIPFRLLLLVNDNCDDDMSGSSDKWQWQYIRIS